MFDLTTVKDAAYDVCVGQYPQRTNRRNVLANKQGKPECAVGHVLHHLGVLPLAWQDEKGERPGAVNSPELRDLFDVDALWFLLYLQQQADVDKVQWRTAYVWALNKVDPRNGHI